MEIRVVGYDHPDAAVLIDEVQQEYVVRYGEPDFSPVDPAGFRPPRGVFAVGYLDGRPVATGAWRAVGAAEDPQLREGDAELKRLYVRAEARGRGLSRRMLAFLEEHAAAAGRRRIVLETGTAQPEAIALYRSCGYRPMPGFGLYKDEAGSRCYRKDLPAPAAPGGPAARAGVGESCGAR